MNVNVDIDVSEFNEWTKKVIADAGVGVKAVITNDVFYVPKLEYGSSRQAPHGMVRVSLREIENVLRVAVYNGITKESAVENGTIRREMVDAVNLAADYGMQLIRDRTPIRTGRARRGWRMVEAK